MVRWYLIGKILPHPQVEINRLKYILRTRSSTGAITHTLSVLMTAALITPVSNCKEGKNANFSKMFPFQIGP